jgi:hypothetical protein
LHEAKDQIVELGVDEAVKVLLVLREACIVVADENVATGQS